MEGENFVLPEKPKEATGFYLFRLRQLVLLQWWDNWPWQAVSPLKICKENTQAGKRGWSMAYFHLRRDSRAASHQDLFKAR
jgi:hypothetical protein